MKIAGFPNPYECTRVWNVGRAMGISQDRNSLPLILKEFHRVLSIDSYLIFSLARVGSRCRRTLPRTRGSQICNTRAPLAGATCRRCRLVPSPVAGRGGTLFVLSPIRPGQIGGRWYGTAGPLAKRGVSCRPVSSAVDLGKTRKAHGTYRAGSDMINPMDRSWLI